MSDATKPVINLESAEEHEHLEGDHFGGYYQILTPSMRPRGGRLGVNLTRVPPGRAACPFHHHQLEDEAFYILSGTGVLRYGDDLHALRPGDCVSCPAGTGIAHQIANTGDEDLIYLAIGNHEPNEVADYPDSGKILVRALEAVGFLRKTSYMEGEPDQPKIFELASTSERC